MILAHSDGPWCVEAAGASELAGRVANSETRAVAEHEAESARAVITQERLPHDNVGVLWRCEPARAHSANTRR